MHWQSAIGAQVGAIGIVWHAAAGAAAAPGGLVAAAAEATRRSMARSTPVADGILVLHALHGLAQVRAVRVFWQVARTIATPAVPPLDVTAAADATRRTMARSTSVTDSNLMLQTRERNSF